MPTNNPQGEAKMTETAIPITSNQIPLTSDPATIFEISSFYYLYTEQREFSGEYVGRYQTESGDWIIQIRNNLGEVSEVVASKLTGWKKVTSTSEL